jgi:hypothetical protein
MKQGSKTYFTPEERLTVVIIEKNTQVRIKRIPYPGNDKANVNLLWRYYDGGDDFRHDDDEYKVAWYNENKTVCVVEAVDMKHKAR